MAPRQAQPRVVRLGAELYALTPPPRTFGIIPFMPPESRPPPTPQAARPPLDPERWLDDHGDTLFRFARLQVHSDEQAEELVQDTLVAALTAADAYAGRATERTWLIGILKRKIVDHYRSKRRDPVAQGSIPPGAEEDAFDRRGLWRDGPARWGSATRAPGADPEFWAAFTHCKSLLPQTLADAFVLREIAELPTETICQVLGVTPNNLWTMLHRARARLRACLEQTWIDAKG